MIDLDLLFWMESIAKQLEQGSEIASWVLTICLGSVLFYMALGAIILWSDNKRLINQ